jgi:phosphoribosylanthranilate isomerase
MILPPRVKICGLTRRRDAEDAVRWGASYLGVVLAPGGKRSVAPEKAAEVIASLPVPGVGVFVDQSEAEVLANAASAGVRILQLHGSESPALCQRLREGGWSVWKAVRTRTPGEVMDAVSAYGDSVDALLLDAWSPVAPGGTGLRFPWHEIAPVRDRVQEPLRLVVAGGLDSGCVGEAIALLQPDVVDVSSGVEVTPGVKDSSKMKTFLTTVRASAPDPVSPVR